MEETLTGQEVDQLLGVAARERLKLDAANVLPPVVARPRLRLYDPAVVKRIATRPALNLDRTGAVLAVRLGVPQALDPETEAAASPTGWTRDTMGWNQLWVTPGTPENNPDRAERAATAWWPVRRPETLVGATLAALVGRVVVAAWRITDWEDSATGPRRRLIVAAHPDADYIASTTLVLGAGALTAVVTPQGRVSQRTGG